MGASLEMGFGGNWNGAFGGAWNGKPAIAPIPSLFDTGLAKPQRTVIRDAVIDMLARLHVDAGGYLLAIEPTSTIVRGHGDEEGLGLVEDQLQGRQPAILVALGDKDFTPAGTDVKSWKAGLVIHLYFISKNLRSRLSRLAGDAQSVAVPNVADPGIEVMMEHAEELLIGELAGAGRNRTIKELKPISEGQLGDSIDVEIWHQTYGIMVTRSMRAKRDLALELQSISTYHRLVQQTAAVVVSQETDITP